jgi:hypothetical protein
MGQLHGLSHSQAVQDYAEAQKYAAEQGEEMLPMEELIEEAARRVATRLNLRFVSMQLIRGYYYFYYEGQSDTV